MSKVHLKVEWPSTFFFFFPEVENERLPAPDFFPVEVTPFPYLTVPFASVLSSLPGLTPSLLLRRSFF